MPQLLRVTVTSIHFFTLLHRRKKRLRWDNVPAGDGSEPCEFLSRHRLCSAANCETFLEIFAEEMHVYPKCLDSNGVNSSVLKD